MPAKPRPMTAKDPVSQFEHALQELETIVQQMERGELRLEDALQLFERGMALTQRCRESLENARLRVQNLLDQQTPPQA